MAVYNIHTSEIKNFTPILKYKDRVILSGTVFTARDAAHKRIFEYIEKKQPLPFEVDGAVIYHAGPTPTPKGLAIGSCGPTTSSRMDKFSSTLFDMGLFAIIGKGQIGENVVSAIKANNGVFLSAIGGAGALASKCVKSCEVIAFEDLGCESIKKLEIVDFPLIVTVCPND